MRNLIEYILLHIVTHPEDVEVTENKIDDNEFEYIIKVNSEDIGRIIGRKGRTIQSIRNLAKVRAMQDDIRVDVQIDDSNSTREEVSDDDANTAAAVEVETEATDEESVAQAE